MWNFSNDSVQKILNKIYNKKYKFPDITHKIFKGSSTGNDNIFLLDILKSNKNTYICNSEELNKTLN